MLEVQLESGDLGDLGFLSNLANGSGTFDGVLSGNLARPAIEGEFTLSGYAYEEWVIDRIEGYARLVEGTLEVNGVHVFEAASELVVEGRYDLERDAPDLELTLVRVEGQVIRAVSGRPLDGVAYGEGRLLGLNPLEVEGFLRVEDLTYDGRLIGSGSGEIIWDRSAVRLTDVSVRNGTQSLDGQGVFELEARRLDVQLQVSGQRLEEFDWLGVPADIGGTVREAVFEVGGTLSEPSVNGRAVIDGLQFRQQRFRQAVIEVSDATGLMHVELETGSRLQLEADVGVYEAGLPFSGLARLREYDGAGWIEGLSGGLTVTGDVRFEGSLEDVTVLQGTGQIERFTTLIDDQELNVTRPFRFRFDTEELEFIDAIAIDGDATSINVSGRIGVSPDAPLDLRINGVVDLTELSPAGADWTSGGTILLGGEIQGDLANPQLSGLANLQGVSLGHSTLPISLSALNGDLYFDRSRIDINNIRGTAGGGEVLISGATTLEGTTPGAFDIFLDVSDIGVRAQSGLRMEFGGELYLRGTRADARLEGEIELESFTFNQPFEAFLDLFGSGVETGESGGALDDLALGIHVRGNRNIRIENELVRVESLLDLDLGGTFGDPSLTGRVEVSDGTLNFLRNRYRITRGNVDFVDPIQIEPLVDVEAETEIRDYRIILTISGRGDDFQLSMRSDPPLSELEVLSLISGGRARNEFSDDQGAILENAPTREQLFQSGAGTILADLLQERVGSRVPVLNSVRVDPFLVGAENDPVARVTVSEQITRDLTITYSQDLSSNSQQIIQIEYFLNSDTSFIASRDETGALGLDIRLRRRFR